MSLSSLTSRTRHAAAVVAIAIAATIGAVGLAAPAQAASATQSVTSPPSDAGPSVSPGSLTGLDLNDIQAVENASVSPDGINWGKVLKILNSEMECQALIPVYEVLYFPSFIFCTPNVVASGATVWVIEFR